MRKVDHETPARTEKSLDELGKKKSRLIFFLSGHPVAPKIINLKIAPKRRFILSHPFGHMNLNHLLMRNNFLFTSIYIVDTNDGISFGIPINCSLQSNNMDYIKPLFS